MVTVDAKAILVRAAGFYAAVPLELCRQVATAGKKARGKQDLAHTLFHLETVDMPFQMAMTSGQVLSFEEFKGIIDISQKKCIELPQDIFYNSSVDIENLVYNEDDDQYYVLLIKSFNPRREHGVAHTAG